MKALKSRRCLMPALTVVLGNTAAYATTAANPASVIATAYYNELRTTQIGDALHKNVADCLSKKTIDPEKARNIDEAIDRYIASAQRLVPSMQADFAKSVELKLSPQEMIDWRDFFVSPAGQAIMDATAKPARAAAASEMKFCKDQTIAALDSDAVERAVATLRPAELSTFRAFATKPAMKKISSINETANEIRIQYQGQMTSLVVASGLNKWIVQ